MTAYTKFKGFVFFVFFPFLSLQLLGEEFEFIRKEEDHYQQKIIKEAVNHGQPTD